MTALLDRAHAGFAAVPVDSPHLMTWTANRYRAAMQANVFQEDDRVELLLGAIIEKTGADPLHEASVNTISDYFTERFFKTHTLRPEQIVQLSKSSMPEPDFAVCKHREDRYVNDYPKPKDVYLLIEVAKSSLSIDRKDKLYAYASAAIAEYWIVNLEQRQLELHLNPDTEYGAYANVNHYKEGNTFESPFVGQVAVADILPPKPEG